MSTMTKLITDKYRTILTGDISSGAKTNQINAAKYISELAAMAGVNIDSWDVTNIFQEKDNPKLRLITNKTVINRIFFKQDNSSAIEEVKFLDPDIAKVMHKYAIYRPSGSGSPEALLASFNKQMAQHQEYNDYANSSLLYAYDYNAKYKIALAEQAIVGESDIPKMIDEVLKEGFFEFKSYDKGEGRIYLITKNEVYLTYVNQSEGVNLNINMGKYKVRFHYKSMELKVLKHSHNTMVVYNGRQNVIHPHVYPSVICFGALSSEAVKAQRERDLPKLMRLVSSILLSYNGDDAYAQLSQYHAKQNGLPDPFSQQAREDTERRQAAESNVRAEQARFGDDWAGTYSREEVMMVSQRQMSPLEPALDSERDRQSLRPAMVVTSEPGPMWS